jgi:hypothetical protein
VQGDVRSLDPVGSIPPCPSGRLPEQAALPRPSAVRRLRGSPDGELPQSAARWHVHHRRKGPAEEPYINHLLEVAMLVADATGGSDTNLVIAALLHDAIEDSELPRELIAETFGEDVASVVVEVTDDKSLPKAQRKLMQIETAATKSPRAKVLVRSAANALDFVVYGHKS